MREEPFLKRWSRRKLEAKEGPPDAADPKAAPDGDVRALDDRSRPEEPPPAPGDKPQDKRELTEADFADVDFEALDYNSDYARFTAPGVPEAIKNRALQKLWMSDAVFTTPDPFQDYLGDYTDAAVAVPPGTLKTAYRIGKGFLTDEEVASGRSWVSRPRPRRRERPPPPREAMRMRPCPLRRSPPTSPRCTRCCASRTPIMPPSIRPRATTCSTRRRWPGPMCAFWWRGAVAPPSAAARWWWAPTARPSSSACSSSRGARPQDRQPPARGAGGRRQGRGGARHPPRDRRAPARVARPLPPARLYRARAVREVRARSAEHVLREVGGVRRDGVGWVSVGPEPSGVRNRPVPRVTQLAWLVIRHDVGLRADKSLDTTLAVVAALTQPTIYRQYR